MLIVPVADTREGFLRYADSADQALRYVDTSTAPQAQARWMPVPPDRALLAGEARFGVRTMPADGAVRQTAMPWAPGHAFVWARSRDGAALVARGRTSGPGGHHVVFSGEAHATLMPAPLVVAAELACPALLGHGRVQVRGDAAGLLEALAGAPVGARAAWDATVADAILAALRAAEGRGALTLAVEAPGDAAAVRELALAELAQRVAAACGIESLAASAALAPPLAPGAAPSLAIDWRPGDRVTLRAVRAVELRAEI